ncbi:SIMPL domain-containing protein [Paracoccus mangrovi]|uniref:SIMPL domain-containing protein n=1 Tax=Paracoccus mangrovi TaxID=1715645 RepID=A0ABV7R8M0_9RHOB
MRQFRPLMTAATLIVLGAGPLAAQGAPGDMPPANSPAHPAMMMHGKHHGAMARLTVGGQGLSSAQPDLATISLGVSSRAATAAEAMTQNAEAQNKVIEALKAEGIEARDIQTSGLNLSPMLDYSKDGEAPRVTGYAAQNNVTVRVRDIAGLGAVLDKLVASGANEIGGINFTREDMTEAEDAARSAAVQDARRRAEIMAEAAGMRLGPLLRLSDTPVESQPVPMMRMMAAEAKGSAPTPVEAGELTVSANVTAIFALLSADDEMPQDGGAMDQDQGSADAEGDAPVAN